MSRHSLSAHSFVSFSVLLLIICFFTWIVLTPFHESLAAKPLQPSPLGSPISSLWNVITFWVAKTFELLVPMNVHSAFNAPTNIIPANWTQKGCYSDDMSSRTLKGHSVSSSSNTPSRCLSSCSSLGYLYGGLEDGKGCYCSNSMVVTLSSGQPQPLSDCSTACAGDSSQTCGGANRIMIYTSSAPLPPYASGNRWNVTDNSPSRALHSYSPPSVFNTPSWHGANRIHIHQRGTTPTPTPSPTQSASYISLGCYVDSWTRVLPGASTSSSANSVSTCSAYCNQQSFAYFGVEYSTECYCGNSVSGSTAPSSDCNMACSGDSSQICGGTWRMNVYSIALSPTITTATTTTTTSPAQTSPYMNLGCFVDSSLRVLFGSSTTFPSIDSPSVCAAYCGKSYAYFGLEYSTECYCGNSIMNAQSASSSDCNFPCSGDSSVMCGGAWRINIYSTGGSTSSTASKTTTTVSATSSSASPTSTPTDWVSVGCYTDTGNPRALGGASTSSSSMTPALCESYCGSWGYTCAGVQYGQECWCGNSITSSSSGGQPTSSSDCSMPCSGDSAQRCGGSWRLNVYQSKRSDHPDGKVVVAHVVVGITQGYTQSTWASHIATATSGGIDGFALNVGNLDWQPNQVASAYAAAMGTDFKLFLSFDMSSLPCGDSGSANLLRQYINNYASHPNQLYYQGMQVVSTFAGDSCTFGQGNINDGWTYAVKQGVTSSVMFIPAFFSDPSTYGSNSVMDGDFDWNAGWPMGDYDTSFSPDQTYISAVPGKKYIAAISPLFFTHYGANSYNKNWIYRSDDWLYSTRWDLLIQNRNQIDIVEIISWNDYGESHYIGPFGPDLSGADAWVTGFDHLGFTTMTKYYADAWRTGTYPTITKNQIFLSARPHSRDLIINSDPVGQPSNWQWTDDFLYAVVFAASSADGGSLQLSIGTSHSTFTVSSGVNKFKLALSPGSPTAILMDSSGQTLISFSPSDFNYVSNPTAYNFNYYMAASP